MTDDTDDEDEYTYEPSVAEQAIRSLVRKAAQRDYGNGQIRRAVKEMLADQRIAEPTAEQLDHRGAAREMMDTFGDRLNRARDRLRNAEKDNPGGSTGIEIAFVEGDGVLPENDGRPLDILVPEDEDPEVVAVARKINYRFGDERVASTYPLVRVGEYPVCTCPDRHYRRRAGGTCYHELAHDFRAGEREQESANEKAVVQV